MFMLVSRRYERASLIVTSNKPFSRLGRDLRRRSHRRGDDRPARSPRRDPRPQRRLLPPQGPRPRPPRPLGLNARGERRSGSPYGLTSATPTAAPTGGQFSPALRSRGGPLLTRRKWHTFQPALTSFVNELVPEASRRSPDGESRGDPLWRCAFVSPGSRCHGIAERGTQPGRTVADEVRTKNGNAVSLRRYRAVSQTSTCAATAVLEGAAARPLRDLLLVVVGAVVSVGIALLLQPPFEQYALAKIAALSVLVGIAFSAWRTSFSLSVTDYFKAASFATLTACVFGSVGYALDRRSKRRSSMRR